METRYRKNGILDRIPRLSNLGAIPARSADEFLLENRECRAASRAHEPPVGELVSLVVLGRVELWTLPKTDSR